MPPNDRAIDGGTSVYDVTMTNSDQTTNEDKSYDQAMPPNDRAIGGGTSVYDTNSDQTTNEDKRYDQTMPPNDRALDGGTTVYEYGSGSLIQTEMPISYPSHSLTHANQPIIKGGVPFSLPKTPSPLNIYYDANTLNEIYNNDIYNVWAWGPLN
ncbi:unnamed protein product [Cuscuta epithymum]|uniref:Uncharacterized protein n=1 Tax=Cuscuta epithymum TaxID=186058 RepID=A0AAV0FD42_9ASTE|nr:unnamed protein product [Cuscuta epithymum]